MMYLDNFFYRIQGHEDKPKMVLLHGLMGSLLNWNRVVKYFENDFHILTFDQRGHGKSFKPDSGYSPEDYAKDLNKILDEVKWSQIHLIGHSMGGRNAMTYSCLFPEKVKTLVIEDIGPDKNLEAISSIEDIFIKIQTPFNSKKEAKEKIFSVYSDEIFANYLYSNITELENSKCEWRFSNAGILQSLYEGRKIERWDEIKKITCPTLLIRGEKSTELSNEVFIKIMQMNKNFKGVTIKDAGHWVHFEKQVEFCKAIEDFYLLLKDLT